MLDCGIVLGLRLGVFRPTLSFREISAAPGGSFAVARLLAALRRTSVFLQFIVQRFQADTKDFRRACFIVSGRLQRAKDQPLLRLVDGGADGHLDLIGIEYG